MGRKTNVWIFQAKKQKPKNKQKTKTKNKTKNKTSEIPYEKKKLDMTKKGKP